MSTTNPMGQIDVRDILSLLWRRKWLIMIPLPLVAALTFAGSYLITPEYESFIIIQIDPQIQFIHDLQRLIDQQTNLSILRGRDRGNILRSIYNEITSSQYAEQLDQRMGLAKNPEIEQQAQLYVRMQPSLPIEKARLAIIQENLKEAIGVEWASADQIKIVVSSTNALKAQSMANHLGDIFIAEKVRQDLNRIRSSQDFTDVQLEKYELQVHERLAAVTRVEQHLARLRTRDATRSDVNRSELEDEIDQTNTEIADLRQEDKSLINRLNDVDNLNTAKLTLDDSNAKRSAERELQSRLSQIGDLLSRYTWSDPQVFNFKLRQNDLMVTVETENQSLVDQQYSEFDQTTRESLVSLFNVRARLNYLYSKKPYLESALGDLTPATDLIPEYEGQLVQLGRELQVATDIRDQFRRQLESSTISQALIEDRSSSNYRKVEPAKLAMKPFKPDRRRILIMGLMLGLAIGGTAVLLVELMDNSFKKVEQVEEILGLKVIGITPKVKFDKRIWS